jgi:hypothetical protein
MEDRAVQAPDIHKPRGRRKRQREQVYLLRLWQVEGDGRSVWRASLEDAHTGERQGFADLALLCSFLTQQTADDSQESTMEISDTNQ